MGLTKQYLRYVPSGNFNIITSGKCNVEFVVLDGQEGRYVAAGAQEHIIIWDFRLGNKALVLVGEKVPVSRLCASTNKKHLAAGYSDGTVQIYDLKSAEVIAVFSGHRSEVTSLSYDAFGHKLASGSADTDVVVWDTVTESGLCRLSGHKGPVTETVFMAAHSVLISSSKDSYIKFWDLDTQHCFRTLVGHHSEVWSVTLMSDDMYLVTACGDMELRVWKLAWKDHDKKPDDPSVTLDLTITNDDDPNHPLQCTKAGSLVRAGHGRVCTMRSEGSGQVLACHGIDKQLELFYFCTEEERSTRFKKRLRKERKNTENTSDIQLSLKDCVKRLAPIKLSDKPKSVCLAMGRGHELRLAVALATNYLQMYSINQLFHTGGKEQNMVRTVETQGHRTDVRAVALSNDGLAVASGSADSVKLWNRPSQVCLCTVRTGAVLSLCFAPGDRHVLAGLEDGNLLIVDVASSDLLETIPAHDAQLWSLCLKPDLNGCVSGGADCTVKFWQFELVHEQSTATKVLSLLHTGTLKLEHPVLCVTLTANSKFIAIALLDTTVKIFFMDTLKLYVSLYGHKLPVLCMDATCDSQLLATGSSDRNIRIWGLDFGDCRKSVFAHDGAVTGLRFVPRTHHLFSCGKDGTVKQWDGDSHVRITSLPGHAAGTEARSLAVSADGRFVVSCGTDRVLRLCERSQEVLVLQDEEEERREQQERQETSVAGRTVGSERAADNILEALQVCETWQADKGAGDMPALMTAYQVTSPEELMVHVVQAVRASDLEEALILLPFSTVSALLHLLPAMMKCCAHNPELMCRLLVLMLRVHHASIVGSTTLLPLLRKLLKLASLQLHQIRNAVGFNLHAMQFLQVQLERDQDVQIFRDATVAKASRDRGKKQREKLKRSHIVMA